MDQNKPVPEPKTQALIEDRFAEVNGIRLHYLFAGQGEPVILLHGYTQTSGMWRPLISAASANPQSRMEGTTKRRWRRMFMPSQPRSVTGASGSWATTSD